jgi:hypothetical protein
MRALALLALSLSLLACARGDIVKDQLDHDDRSIVLVARPFGFESNGVLDIKVSNWKVYLEEGMTTYKKDKLGFFITTAEAEAQLQQDLEAGAWPLSGGAGEPRRDVPTGPRVPLGRAHRCQRALTRRYTRRRLRAGQRQRGAAVHVRQHGEGVQGDQPKLLLLPGSHPA